MIGIGERQLWRDEHSTYWASVLSAADLWRLLHNVDIVFAPFYVFMHGWIWVFGDSLTALRLPAVLAMAAAATLLAALGKRLFSARVGVIAGMLFAVVPGVTRYGQEARPYALVLAAVIAGMLMLVRAVDRPKSWTAWAAYAVTLVAIGWTHLVALCVLIAYATFVVAAARRAGREDGRRLLVRWLGATAVGLLPTGPLAIEAVGQTGQISWIGGSDPSLIELPELLFQSSVVAAAVIGLAVVGAALLRGRSLAFVVWAVVPPLVLFFTFDLFHLFYFRYLLFTLPAWVILAAVAIEEVVRLVSARQWGIHRAVGVTAVLGLVAVLGFSVTDQAVVRRDPPPGEPDFRSAAAVVSTFGQAGDAIAYGGDRNGGIKSLRRAMAYELRGSARPDDIFLTVSPQARGQFAGVENREPGLAVGEHRRVWLITHVVSGDPFAQMPDKRAELLRARFTVARVWKFTQLKVLLLSLNTLPGQS